MAVKERSLIVYDMKDIRIYYFENSWKPIWFAQHNIVVDYEANLKIAI